MIAKITHRELEEVMMEPDEQGVDEPYFIIQSKESGEHLLMISAGKNGVEFNKIYGFFHHYPQVLIYHCLYGQGILLVQKNDDSGEAKEIRIVSLRPGVEAEIPSGYGHTIINVGKNFLVMIDNALVDGEYLDTEAVKRKKGLAYYVIDKKGDIAFEKNPNYSYHPQIMSY